VRWNFVAGIFLGAVLFSRPGSRDDAALPLLAVLLISAFIGALPGLELDANLFGFEGRGFRRLLLAPIPLGGALRSISLASLLLSLPYAFVAIGIWSLVFGAFEPRVLALMVFSAMVGVLLLKSAGIWGSVLLPRPCEYGVVFRNQSGAGNWLMFGAAFALLIGALAARFLVGDEGLIRYWWAASVVVVVSAAVYVWTLIVGGRVLDRRRETVLNVVEQRG
jgi:hypothetical protein